MSCELKFYSLQTLIARICTSIKSPNMALWSLILQKNTIFSDTQANYFMAYISVFYGLCFRPGAKIFLPSLNIVFLKSNKE